MELFVVQSDEFLKNHYFVVDEKNLHQITQNDTKYQRLQEHEELRTLEAYNNGDNEKFEIIRGKPYDFFVALIRKTFL